MRKRPRSRLQLPLVVILVIFLLTSSYALTAANTVPATRAGTGAASVTPYTVTDVLYTIDVLDNPQQLLSASLKLGGNVPSSVNVRVRFRAAGSWYPCTVGAFDSVGNKTAVTCSVTGAGSVTADNLTVVAVQ